MRRIARKRLGVPLGVFPTSLLTLTNTPQHTKPNQSLQDSGAILPLVAVGQVGIQTGDGNPISGRAKYSFPPPDDKPLQRMTKFG